MRPIYNDEIYHYGKIGMKWHNHKAKVEAKKKQQKQNDREILKARRNTDAALEDYNYKAMYSNRHRYDKKAQKDVDDAFNHLMEIAAKSNQRTSKEKNKQRTLAVLAGIGSVAYVAGSVYVNS